MAAMRTRIPHKQQGGLCAFLMAAGQADTDRPAWAWRDKPILLAGGALPETVCSHLGGAGGGAWQLLSFLDRGDAAALQLVCRELRDMRVDYGVWRRLKGLYLMAGAKF